MSSNISRSGEEPSTHSRSSMTISVDHLASQVGRKSSVLCDKYIVSDLRFCVFIHSCNSNLIRTYPFSDIHVEFRSII